MSLDNMQSEWVAEHLGHSMDVEKTYYRMMSTTIELTKISKLLMLADTGRIGSFKGKTIDEIEAKGMQYIRVTSYLTRWTSHPLKDNTLSLIMKTNVAFQNECYASLMILYCIQKLVI